MDSNEPEVDIAEQQAVRMAKREAMLASGVQPYPVAVPVDTTIGEVRGRFGHLGLEEKTGENVGVAGRVMHVRLTGKLAFAALQDGSGNPLQAMVSFGEVGEEAFDRFRDWVDLGDHLFVHGEVVTSKRGELSVWVSHWQIASKALLPLPTLHSELAEETRVRQRYLDLIVRDQARQNVRIRALAMKSLRDTLNGHEFLEVETPMLQTLHGGATARPFVTHSNAFDIDLFLRIAPELFLKRAVVGGIERVFEINRNFRNEGADSTHSPEFSMLEAYQAYTDYSGMADLTQELVQNAALAVSGSLTVTWSDGTTYDLGGDWDRLSLYRSLSDAIGHQVTPGTRVEELQELAEQGGVQVAYPSHGKLVEELWEHHVKSALTRPTFVMDFPLDTSPLVREHREIQGVVEKWDLYVRGFELATGYSELVDPVIQRHRFIEQGRMASGGDPEAMSVDADFLRALEYGMPPTGGMGMGIDRLLMAVTGLGIRDTVLFPLVKPD